MKEIQSQLQRENEQIKNFLAEFIFETLYTHSHWANGIDLVSWSRWTSRKLDNRSGCLQKINTKLIKIGEKWKFKETKACYDRKSGFFSESRVEEISE